MKHLFAIAATLFFIFLVSCDSNSDNKEPQVTPAASSVTANPFSTNNNDSLATGLTLNPEHGKPGHRCEIAVGAPLNTPVTNNTIQQTIAPTILPADAQKVAPNSNNATVALNPQHGQPGHRCDIAVGAPLNSKPTQ